MQKIPKEFLDRLSSEFQKDKYYDSILINISSSKVTTFRLNTISQNPDLTIKTLQEEGFQLQKSSFSSIAYSLQNKSKKELQQTEAYKKGHIYLQSYASQIPVLALDPKSNEKVLDLTAAPGSKTSQIAAAMNLQGELHANDLNTIRYNKLIHTLTKQNILKQGQTFLKTHNKHGLELLNDFPDEYFDKILLDVPCSGECRFNSSYPKSYKYWSLEHSKNLSERQSKLIQAAFPKLKPGGQLVYSTCTYTIQENEQVIQSLLEKFPYQIDILEPSFDGLEKSSYSQINLPQDYSPEIQKCYRIMPTDQIEGFFIAKIQKCTK